MGTSGTRSWGLRKVQSPCDLARPLRIPLLLLPGPRSSSGVEIGISGLLFSADMELGVLLEFPQGCQSSSRVEVFKSALHSSWISRVRLPVWVARGIGGFLSRCHKAVTLAIVF